MSEKGARLRPEEDLSLYSHALIQRARNPRYFGRMNDPTGSAYVQGLCGDEMEFYCVITNDVIEEVTFYTRGCVSTIVCGSMAAELVHGKTVSEALALSPRTVIQALEGLPDEGYHCAILAVSTLYKAIADYLLKP